MFKASKTFEKTYKPQNCSMLTISLNFPCLKIFIHNTK